MFIRSLTKAVFVVVLVHLVGTANAATVAVYANGSTNPSDAILAGYGHTVMYVTDADIAAGLANGADVFFYTRSTASFGSDVSAAAASQILANFGNGNVALFMTDLTDLFLDPNYPGHADAGIMLDNAVDWTAATKGFIGEFNGAGWALENGLLPGTSGGENFAGSYNPQTNLQPGHPVMAGIAASFTGTNQADYLSFSSGIPGINQLAIDPEGRVTIAAGVVPEPATILTVAAGLGLLARRRRK